MFIFQDVTIGATGSGKIPVIGDNVRIFCNSVVLGDITIGDNVTIGAGAVVIKDVPSGCTVVGNPAHVVDK